MLVLVGVERGTRHSYWLHISTVRFGFISTHHFQLNRSSSLQEQAIDSLSIKTLRNHLSSGFIPLPWQPQLHHPANYSILSPTLTSKSLHTNGYAVTNSPLAVSPWTLKQTSPPTIVSILPRTLALMASSTQTRYPPCHGPPPSPSTTKLAK